MADRSPTPAPLLVAQLRQLLMQHAPFSQMPPTQVDRLVAAAEESYHPPGETVLAPHDGPVGVLLYVRSGTVHGTSQRGGPPSLWTAGDVFPVGALLAGSPANATYVTQGDVFLLRLPGDAVRAVAADCAPFAGFLNRRMWKLLEDAQRALQARSAAPPADEQPLEVSLRRLVRGAPVTVDTQASVGAALGTMREKRIGSVLVVGAAGALQGIFTRHDVLDRVALAAAPLDTPIAQVMSAPVHALDADRSGQDAALAMARHGIRHVAVTDGGRLVGVVSERDLFALQRLSVHGVAGEIRAAQDAAALRDVAADIRRLARNLVAQGTGARALTALISHLNDLLAERLVVLEAAALGLDLGAACWLAFGSEGRGEQTIATDQDNGIVFASDDAARDRPRWLALAERVNLALDACGYPLCKGNVMARNPDCCLSVDEWLARFAQWMEHGAPEDLLAASIYFDLRGVAGHLVLAERLRTAIVAQAAGLPRLHRQLAENLLQRRPPLGWLGGLETVDVGGRAVIDLKLQGTAIFVDAARLYALVHGVAATGTRERFAQAGARMGVPAQEHEAWAAGFEFLQMLRLSAQWRDGTQHPNEVEPEALNQIDRRVLHETLRIARRLQQRVELDYMR
jgi:CBS domain-containing protein